MATVAGAAVLALGSAGPALAHTELVSWTVEAAGTAGSSGSASLPAGAGSPSGPAAPAGARLRLHYSEPIDGRFLTVSLLDLQGDVTKTATPTIDPARRTDGLVDLADVAPGPYTVAWWTRALDGDPSSGSFILGYRTSTAAVDLLPPVGARDPATQPGMFWEDTAWGTLLRWLTYVASALLIGALWFALFVWRPVWGRSASRGSAAGAPSPDRLDEVDRQASRTFRLIALAGAGSFLATSLILLVLQVGFVRYSLLQPVTSVAPTPLGPSALSHEAPYKALVEILSGRNGQVWIARMVVGFAALAAAATASPRWRRQNWRWLLALVAAAGAVFTVSLSSHSGVIPGAPWARFLDWAHLVVMSAWIGGLLPLLLTVRRLRSAPGGEYAGLAVAVSSRFSNFALGAFLFMAGTGFVEAYLNVGRLGLIPPTTYGRVLIAKLALFAVLFGFGALHRRWTLRGLAPALASPDRRRRRTALEKTLPFEFAAGLSVLLVVALMASLATSKTVWPAHQRLGYHASATASEVSVTLRAVPGTAGQNAVALDVVDRRLGPATAGGAVTLGVGGRTLSLAPVGAPSAGSAQRFVASDLADLAVADVVCDFTYLRPSYPEVRGSVRLALSPPVNVTPEK